MKKYNFKLGLTSLFLSLVLLLGFLLPSFPIGKPILSKATESTNDDFPTVEEEIEDFLSRYDEYEYFQGEEPGEIIVRETVYIPGGEEVYQTSINYLDEDSVEFFITISTYYYGELIEEEYVTVQPYYDEEDDEYYVTIDDGEPIYIYELIIPNTIGSRIAIADDIAIAAAYLAVSAVIICYPYIQTIVETICTYVTNVLSSFRRWLNNLFTTKIFVTTTTTVLSYRITVFGRDFVLDKVENADERPREEDYYFLAIVKGNDVCISNEEISEAEAVAVLAENIYVRIENKNLQLNTYTFEEWDAKSIAIQAAVRNGLSGADHHDYHNKKQNKKGTFFDHYHPGEGKMKYPTHSFFGYPHITL